MCKNSQNCLKKKTSASLLAFGFCLVSGISLAAMPEPDENGMGGTGHQAPLPDSFTRPELPPAMELPVIVIPPDAIPSVPSSNDVTTTPSIDGVEPPPK